MNFQFWMGVGAAQAANKALAAEKAKRTNRMIASAVIAALVITILVVLVTTQLGTTP
jgi:hypothetical protein